VGFVRARTEEQVISRQEEIIKACDVLFSQSGYEGINLKAISEMTSFKRPTIYIYYKTKDEVLIDLLKREMLYWNTAMQTVIKTTETMTKEQYCGFLTESTVPRDKMLALLAILCTNIENQCRLERLTEFKKEAGAALTTIRESLDKYFSHADLHQKNFFMAAFMSYLHGLYPLAFLSQKQIAAMKMAGMAYEPLDFKDTFYHGVLLLLADL
jgi:AcrR family transcriptional regulator